MKAITTILAMLTTIAIAPAGQAQEEYVYVVCHYEKPVEGGPVHGHGEARGA